MTRISQIISVVGGVNGDVTSQVATLERTVTQPELLSGLSRTHRPRQDDGVTLPGQEQRVQVTAEQVIDKLAQLYTRLLDTTRTLDESNARAAADVTVDGTTLLPQVTVSHLMFLERKLADLHGFVTKIPVLDQAAEWTDEGTDAGVHKTVPVETTSTTKVPYNHVKAEATPQHPAQVEIMARDEITGFWTTVKFSGALDPRRKRTLLDRITALQEAVKFAREEANSSQVDDVREGKRIFDWLLRD